MHHHGTDGRWHMSYGIKLVLSLIYEDYILTCISNQIPLYSTRCNYLSMPNYVNDLTMQQILACLQSPIAFSLFCFCCCCCCCCCYLPKFTIFGKYVRLSVCYLPKFTFWQVCSFVGLLLAKIYNFWQVCSFVSLSVCLSVCLLVCQFCQA